MRTMTGAMPAPLDDSIGPLLSSATSLAAYGWAAREAFRYHALLRRRLALGLADPVVTHQFLLWGVSAGSAFGSSAVSLFFTHVLGLSIAATVVPFVAIQLALFTAAVCLWFAFFPPGFYRRRLLRVAAD